MLTLLWIGAACLLVLGWCLVRLHLDSQASRTRAEIAAELRAVCRETNRELDRKRLEAIAGGEWRKVR